MKMSRRRSPTVWIDRRRRWKRNSVPPPVPNGWVAAAPDFVGIGVEKAGTSWWYELLIAHPATERPRLANKELRFFNRFATRPFGPDHVRRYADLLARPEGQLCGEWTPSYITDYWVPPLLSQCAPNTRLLVILRDPVNRFVSSLAQTKKRGQPDTTKSRQRSFDRGCYSSQLERVWEFFTREQTLVLQYELCREQPAVQLRRTYEFIGLDPDFVPDGIERPIHATTWEKPVLEDRALRDLARAYAPEIARLAALCPDLDLDRWTAPD